MKKISDTEVAEIGRALGDPNRLSIYMQISQCMTSCSSGEIHAKQARNLCRLRSHTI